ncbi:MAG: hypothetical protein LIO85_10975 [Rikenellaceae bacterium]|nr:hypothetical protein [Rikenellaceae bacterium]
MKPEKKYFSIRQTVLSALLLGPLGGAIVIFINCRNFGMTKTGTKVVIYSVIYLLFLLLINAATHDDMVEKLIWLCGATAFNCLAAWLISESVYGKELESHAASGGGYYNSWNIVVAAAVVLVVCVGLLLLVLR